MIAHLQCAEGYRCAVHHTHPVSLRRHKEGGELLVVYRELSSLVLDLGVSAKTLYAVSNTLDKHYRQVQLPKRDGGHRELSVPDPLLKMIQRRIAQVLLVHMPVSNYATAYRYGGSIRRNAAPHVGQPVLLKLDIRHFFDSIPYSMVKEAAFPAEIYAGPLRILLAMLCYYRDALPQGAPTSPCISNIIMRGFDDEVGAWCRGKQITYTRYCDDMTFSGSFDAEEVERFVAARARELGFYLNAEKTKVLPAGRQQTVTGIVVNEKLNVPASYRRALRQELYFCRKFGVSDHMARSGICGTEEQYLAQLLGRVGYVSQISPGRAELEEARAWLLETMAHPGRR